MALFDTNTGKRGRRRLAVIHVPKLSLGASNGLFIIGMAFIGRAGREQARCSRELITNYLWEQHFTGLHVRHTAEPSALSSHSIKARGKGQQSAVSNGPNRGDESPGTLAVSAASSLSETNANAQPTELCDTENAEGISRQHASD